MPLYQPPSQTSSLQYYAMSPTQFPWNGINIQDEWALLSLGHAHKITPASVIIYSIQIMLTYVEFVLSEQNPEHGLIFCHNLTIVFIFAL